ncbi:MAG: sterol desaturase family protein [Alphaproteobacteria bacterium]|nr:sterol desaturase family protein [Alphaproteobacteria bacterium]
MEVLPGISEPVFRFSIFAAALIAMALIELMIPRRKLSAPKLKRWATNFTIVAIDTAVVRLMGALAVPLVAVAAAVHAESNGWGLFNVVALPGWLEFLLALLILDLAIWFQHLVSHKVPLLWRLHRVHHADVDIDVSTAIRFHPIEIALSMLWKIALVFVFGPSALAVVVFEVILNACAMFNHANIALPRWLDPVLRALIVTPDMHRVHHSVIRREHDSNYGFNLSIWDRLFGTYNDQPEKGHDGMKIGLEQYPAPEPTRLIWSLALPFGSKPGKH